MRCTSSVSSRCDLRRGGRRRGRLCWIAARSITTRDRAIPPRPPSERRGVSEALTAKPGRGQRKEWVAMSVHLDGTDEDFVSAMALHPRAITPTDLRRFEGYVAEIFRAFGMDMTDPATAE